MCVILDAGEDNRTRFTAHGDKLAACAEAETALKLEYGASRNGECGPIGNGGTTVTDVIGVTADLCPASCLQFTTDS